MHDRTMFFALLSSTCLAVACAGDEVITADTDVGTTGTSMQAADTEPADPDTSTSSSTTGAPGDSSSGDEEGGFVDRPDMGSGLDETGICWGVSAIGHLGTVHAAPRAVIEPECDVTPAPCGGDLVGVWTVESDCGLDALPNFFADACPSSNMVVVEAKVEGIRTFDEDLTFTQDLTFELDTALEIDSQDCFGVDCGTFGQLLSAEPGLEASCTAAQGDTCDCMLSITEAGIGSGTYQVVDEGVVLNLAEGSTDPLPFCATSERLDLWEPLYASQSYEDTPCRDANDCIDALGDAEDTWYCID